MSHWVPPPGFEIVQAYDVLTGHYFAEITRGAQTWIIHAEERDHLHQEVGRLLRQFGHRD